MIVHHIEMDATLWDDYSDRYPILQKQLFQSNLKFCIMFMTLLVCEFLLFATLFVIDRECFLTFVYIIMSYFSAFIGFCFGLFSVKWSRQSLYFESPKARFRSSIRAIVLLVGVMVPLIGSYFVVWEPDCNKNSSLILSAFMIQMIRSPMTLSIQ
eukprot:NODE_420_length_8944_cov_0.479819.p3 type:complete len:155 gc:universal NODE_420_length_8944_cov_0.479819:4586-4122(-)